MFEKVKKTLQRNFIESALLPSKWREVGHFNKISILSWKIKLGDELNRRSENLTPSLRNVEENAANTFKQEDDDAFSTEELKFKEEQEEFTYPSNWKKGTIPVFPLGNFISLLFLTIISNLGKLSSKWWQTNVFFNFIKRQELFFLFIVNN